MSHLGLTLHPFAACRGVGFIPAIVVRNAAGMIVSTKTPTGAYREFNTYTRAEAAEAQAWLVARRIAAARPEHFAAL